MLPLYINVHEMQWSVVGGGEKAHEVLNSLLKFSEDIALFVIAENCEKYWKGLASKLIFAFFFMVVGYIVISYLPLPGLPETWTVIKPYINYQLLFFACAGFIAQMVDGTLGMGYGVTSATCLMTLGINPVSVSAAIHTSEIFTTATSGYSHYKFKNVNKKMFRHLVIPGVVGAILGAVMLVFVGEK